MPAAEIETVERLRERMAELEQRVLAGERGRRALLHMMSDLNDSNRRLADQRKAMLHILADYEHDRRRLGAQAERLDNSRRALLHILQDTHESKLRLERSRKAMIHIMGDLRETTQEVERREQQLREQQEQLVQVGKLATLGELATGVAHELNNPLNNVGLFVGNAIDQIEAGLARDAELLEALGRAAEQVEKATQIISHLRTFGRAAPARFEPVDVDDVLERALSLMEEQLRLRQIEVVLDLDPVPAVVDGNAIQLEQVFLNLLTNARDALAEAPRKQIGLVLRCEDGRVVLVFRDTGPGIPAEVEGRIFDPFFTTKEVGSGTGLGLSIAYGIVRDHGGTISLASEPGEGAAFRVELPLSAGAP
jgi:two-component system C4-dicarboxylate transport sensor histidine kinase DctB